MLFYIYYAYYSVYYSLDSTPLTMFHRSIFCADTLSIACLHAPESSVRPLSAAEYRGRRIYLTVTLSDCRTVEPILQACLSDERTRGNISVPTANNASLRRACLFTVLC